MCSKCMFSMQHLVAVKAIPQTYAIKTRVVTDNWTIKNGPVRGTEGPVTRTAPPFIRKILVSVKCLSAIPGPEMAAPILWTPGKKRPFCRKSHVHKIPRFGGDILGFLGGGEVPILFLWACRFF